MNDIKLGMLSLFGLFLLALEHRLRVGGLWKWVGAKWAALRSAAGELADWIAFPYRHPRINADDIESVEFGVLCQMRECPFLAVRDEKYCQAHRKTRRGQFRK